MNHKQSLQECERLRLDVVKREKGRSKHMMTTMTTQDQSVLHVKGITKKYPGVVALKNVNFRLLPGKVHALMGENGAGKSTLMKIIAGIIQADEGQILLHGKQVEFHSPKQALDNGIAMIHQELNPILDMTIAENLFLGKECQFGKTKIIDYKQIYRSAISLLKRVGMNINPSILMRDLTVSQMQMVEIAKALSYEAEIIIMDEPSSTITNREVSNLFKIIKNLKAEGRCIVYITHKMDEVFKIADEITVFRDGNYIGTYEANEIKEKELVRKMVDRELNEIYPLRSNKQGEVKFSVKNLSQEGVFENISFELRAGEILGFAGLMGAGRSEVMNAIFGITKPSSGEIHINGKEIKKPEPSKIISHGLGYVTEDRKGTGLIMDMSIQDNVTISSLLRLSTSYGKIKRRQAAQESIEFISKLRIKTPSANQLVKGLSGGNQQKVVLAKWLMMNPDILVFDEPTRGIDVGAKTEIYKLVAELAEQGKAIIFISSEMPEILGMCDRIIVLHEGHISGETDISNATQEMLLTMAAGLNNKEEIK